jgi:enediyne biosynthesis thioesterase
MRHVVSFEDTNVVGNVYYVNHLRWQGRCREMFLHEHAPEVVERLGRDLTVVTVRCGCEYLGELFAFDEVLVRMRLDAVTQGRMTMRFEYWRVDAGGEQLVARGLQEIACMRRDGGRPQPAPWPTSFLEAVERFSHEQLQP